MKMPRTFRGPVLWLCFSDEASAPQYEHNTRGHSVPLEDTTRREGVPRETYRRPYGVRVQRDDMEKF